jgi:hypothetical protein
MSHLIRSALLASALLCTPLHSEEIPKLIFANETEVILLLPGEEEARTLAIADLPAADQEAIAQWRESAEGKAAKRPVSPKPKKADSKKEEEDEEPVYDPNASYRDRQKALAAAFEDIPDNFDDSWPKLVKSPEDITVELVEENEEDRRYVYHSDHYEFICDVALKPHLVKRFAVLFEGTREFCRQLPITTKKAHVAGKTHRNRILLFETMATYHQNGGPPGSAGVFMGGSDVVMVPLPSLGVKKLGSSYTIDYDADNKTLTHELTHQITDRFYYQAGARGWFSEGLAEYVAVTPYRSGKFMLTKAVKAAKEYATEYGRDGNGGRALGDEINAPALKDYMLQDYSSFVANGNFNYGLGLLITTYFFEIEGRGDRVAITAFLKALREGKEGEEALEALLQGRSYFQLAEDISKGWKSKGVDIDFAMSSE